MSGKNVFSACNRWLVGGTVIAIASLALIFLSPRIVGATMGCGGDGIGQFFYMIMIGGFGLGFLCISCIFLLLLSLMAWNS